MYSTLRIGTYTVLLFGILSGCGEAPVGNETVANKTVTPAKCAEDYFNSTVSTTLNACVSCHSNGGQAQTTRFILQAPLVDNKSLNFTLLQSFIKLTGNLIIDKGTNTTPHTGGVAMNSSSKVIMQDFMAYANGSKTCASTPSASNFSSGDVSLLSVSKTLRSASIKLSGTTPTDATLSSVSSIDSLDKNLDEYMKSDYFYKWLHIKFNDILLTDFYASGRRAEDLLNGKDFVNKYWYDKYRTKSNTDKPNMFSNSERYRIYQDTNYAIAREATNLMAYVIKNNRPFSEILTADYVLVNPYSARTYGININGFSFDDADLDLSIDAIEAKYPKEALREAKIEGIPHAGLLTTITYLNRFPSTNTNLDRHRSAKTQLFFLDTDILALANRPIKAIDVIGNSATWTNPNCTVCHNIMEPISGAFSNWDNRGRYRPGWRTELAPFSQEPGLSIERKAPASASKNILQWLAKEMVKDDRFAMASVKMFLKAILSRDALKKPENGSSDYNDALQAYNYENEILTQIKEKFKASNMNAKVIIKEIIKSPLYRANGLNTGNRVLSRALGQAHLITPEALNQKIFDTFGYYWSRNLSGYSQKDNNKSSYHRLLQDRDYATLYGGINSGSISKRVDELNGVMANVQLRMAMQMACFPTTRDFYFAMNKRKLFPYVTKTEEPLTDGTIGDIKKNIQYLHKHILGEELSLNDPEIEATYKLFYDTYIEGKQRVYDGLEERSLLGECRMYYNPFTFKRLSQEGHPQDEIIYDDKYVIRSWSAVVSYLVSDFKFLYETSAK